MHKYWSELKIGEKIGVNGTWEEMVGLKQLNAVRIDIL